MPIHYFEHSIRSGLTQKRKLSAFLLSVAKEYLPSRKKVSIHYIFCSDDYLLEKNIAFLGHHTLTDIITFDLSEQEAALSAEIYISVERVKENAASFSVPYTEELHRVIFHGLLHLCGFKDKTAAEKAVMRQKEQDCLNRYFS